MLPARPLKLNSVTNCTWPNQVCHIIYLIRWCCLPLKSETNSTWPSTARWCSSPLKSDSDPILPVGIELKTVLNCTWQVSAVHDQSLSRTVPGQMVQLKSDTTVPGKMTLFTTKVCTPPGQVAFFTT